MYVIVMDRWIPEKYFDDNEYREANKYLEYCRRNYIGPFELRRCSDNFPRIFEKAVMRPSPPETS